MGLAITVLLLVGGYIATFTHLQGWGIGMVLFRSLGNMALLAGLMALFTWLRARRLRREIQNL